MPGHQSQYQQKRIIKIPQLSYNRPAGRKRTAWEEVSQRSQRALYKLYEGPQEAPLSKSTYACLIHVYLSYHIIGLATFSVQEKGEKMKGKTGIVRGRYLSILIQEIEWEQYKILTFMVKFEIAVGYAASCNTRAGSIGSILKHLLETEEIKC